MNKQILAQIDPFQVLSLVHTTGEVTLTMKHSELVRFASIIKGDIRWMGTILTWDSAQEQKLLRKLYHSYDRAGFQVVTIRNTALS